MCVYIQSMYTDAYAQYLMHTSPMRVVVVPRIILEYIEINWWSEHMWSYGGADGRTKHVIAHHLQTWNIKIFSNIIFWIPWHTERSKPKTFSSQGHFFLSSCSCRLLFLIAEVVQMLRLSIRADWQQVKAAISFQSWVELTRRECETLL